MLWLISATYQSLVFFYFPVQAAQSAQNYSGKMLGVWDVSTLAYTIILTTVNLRLMMAASSLNKWHAVGVGGSIFGWFLFVFIYSGIQVSFIQVLITIDSRDLEHQFHASSINPVLNCDVLCAGKYILGDVHFIKHLVLLVPPVAGSNYSSGGRSSCSIVSLLPSILFG